MPQLLRLRRFTATLQRCSHYCNTKSTQGATVFTSGVKFFGYSPHIATSKTLTDTREREQDTARPETCLPTSDEKNVNNTLMTNSLKTGTTTGLENDARPTQARIESPPDVLAEKFRTHCQDLVTLLEKAALLPNPLKIRIISQYPAESHDFSWLASENHDVQLVIVSAQNFEQIVKHLPRDAVIVNLIDNVEEDTKTGAIGGKRAIATYEAYGHAYTGASPRNFATLKSQIKKNGVNSPRYVIIRDRSTQYLSPTEDGKSLLIQIQSPDYDSVNKSLDSSEKKAEKITQDLLHFPLIVKPHTDFGGSTHIRKDTKVHNFTELERVAKGFPVPDMICEEFIDGREYAALVFEELPKYCISLSQVRRTINTMLNYLRKTSQMSIKNVVLPATAIQFIKRRLNSHRKGASSAVVLDPIEVVLPSGETFQHEDLKWRMDKYANYQAKRGRNFQGAALTTVHGGVEGYFSVSIPSDKCPHSKRGEQSSMASENNSKESSACLSYRMVQTRREAKLRKTMKTVIRRAWKSLKHDGYFRYDIRVNRSAFENESPSGVESLRKPKPRQNDVHIIDANPYCSLFGTLDNLDEADTILRASGKSMNHKHFTGHLVKLAIQRELLRRLSLVSSLLNVLKQDKREYATNKRELLNSPQKTDASS
mmetsp:Transcript_11624/g.15468  ORF Transcript_11624/g.15468 Transcript_11624/m.15468 type:complete len:653 (-) Transcript_11624:610-2568(-)